MTLYALVLRPVHTPRAPLRRKVVLDDLECLAKGDRASFVWDEESHLVEAEPDWVICQELQGRMRRECDFYIAEYRFLESGHELVSDEILKAGVAYYGEKTRWEQGVIALPEKGWQHLARIDAIRYRRRGTKNPGMFSHPFEEPQDLSYTTQLPLVYRVRLPDSCVADERGFVAP